MVDSPCRKVPEVGSSDTGQSNYGVRVEHIPFVRVRIHAAEKPKAPAFISGECGIRRVASSASLDGFVAVDQHQAIRARLWLSRKRGKATWWMDQHDGEGIRVKTLLNVSGNWNNGANTGVRTANANVLA